jgi:hypothetical protein
VPTVASATSNVPGASITVTGTLFTGVSEASGAGASSSPTNYPLVELTAAGSAAELFLPVTAYGPASLTATLPATALQGAYLLRVVVNGVPSAAVPMAVNPPLSISPATATTAPRGAIAFSASGGSGAGYTWSLATNASGGSIAAATGAYAAGATGNVTDVVRVTDSLGNTATRSVTVTAALAISPTSASAPPRGTVAFTASGGGGGITWSLTTNGSGGSVNATTGAYLAGTTGSRTDVVTATDALGATTSATVTVTAGVSISPASASLPPRGTRLFSASGGSGTGFTWAFATNASGGSVDAFAGAYTAGTTGNVTDVLRVTDSLGNTATVTVAVTAGLAIAPATVSLPPRGGQAFSASGGSGTGLTWSLAVNASGGTIVAATGAYVAGTTGSVTDVVQVTDSLGNVATRNVAVTAGLTISPATPSTTPKGPLAFTASGGSGAGLTWSLATNASGGSIGAATGAYVAGTTGSVTDVVRVTDSLGNTATRSVTVGPGVSISPAFLSIAPKATQNFNASGGSGSGWSWSLTQNQSGGTVNGSGNYKAGTSSGTDVLRVTDSLGNAATVTITVTSGVRITPAGASLAPRATQTFTASAGSGTGYTWTLQTNSSGGSIGATSGVYVAGATPGVVDTVLVTDSLGNTATAPVDVGAGVTISPAGASAPPRGGVTFTASGGSGLPYTWSLSTNASGGSIDATGIYKAGPTPNVTDVVQAADSLGNVATRSVAVGPGVTIAAAGVVPPRGAHTFTASGGSGTGWSWSLSTNASGGSIAAATGAYTAGATGGVIDVVRVVDSLGNAATLSVTVGPDLAIAPAAASVAPRGGQAFTATGGSGGGLVWSLSTNASGGGIDVSTGAYVAGPTPNVTDVVHLTDSLGNTATRSVTVGPGVSIAPATASVAPRGSQTFTAGGGSGAGWTWTLATNASGGSIDAATGAYVAGATPSVTDVVRATDSLGNSATRAVTVTAGVSVSPASVAVRDGTTRTFTASGGSGTGFTWSLTTNASGGSIGASTGVYQAGATPGVDTVLATDSLGNTATASATVTRLFADLAFDLTSAGSGAMVTATLTVYNDTSTAVTVTPPGYDELTLTHLVPGSPVLDPAPDGVVVAAGASAQFRYALAVSGSPGDSYVAAAQAQTKEAGPTNLATTPAGTIAEVRVDWAPAALVASRGAAPYRFSLAVRNDGASPVTRVEIDDPQPGSFTGLAADPATCSSTALPTASTGAGFLAFTGSLAPGASTTLCFAFTGVPSVTVKTSYPFTVAATRSGGSPPVVTYGRSVRLDVVPPDVGSPSVLSDAGGQTLDWVNPGAPHDGVVVFRTTAPDVPTIPDDYVDYRLLPDDQQPADLLYADAGYSAVDSYDDPIVGRYNYRICNHDADFVYSSCSAGFWNGEGWLDSAEAPPGGWTQQLGGAVFNLPGVVPGASVSVATNAPSVVTLNVATGDRATDPVTLRAADPVVLPALPSRDTPVATLAGGRTLLFAADAGGTVTAVDVTTGALAWQVTEAGEGFVAGVSGTLRQYAAPAFQAAYAGDVLFMGSTSGRLLALDASSGATLWTLSAGAPIRATARYDATNNWLYVATSGGGVIAYDLGTSSATTPPATAVGWVNPGGTYRLGCTGGTASSDLACVDDGGVVQVMSKATGAVKASRSTGLASPSTFWMVRATPAGFVVSNASRVQRLALSGTTLSLAGEWAPAGVTLSPAQVFPADGTIYVGGSDGALHKLVLATAADTGLTAAIASEDDPAQLGPPAYDVVNDLFLFGTDAGRLWAVKKF